MLSLSHQVQQRVAELRRAFRLEQVQALSLEGSQEKGKASRHTSRKKQQDQANNR